MLDWNVSHAVVVSEVAADPDAADAVVAAPAAVVAAPAAVPGGDDEVGEPLLQLATASPRATASGRRRTRRTCLS
jgi:hypothetical protein